MNMPLEKSDIDTNRRTFIKLSFVIAGAFVLGKISGLFSWTSGIATKTSGISKPSRALPVGTKEYQNAQYGFSFLYPSDLKVSTFEEGGDTATMTFQNTERGEGLQVFVVPYRGQSPVSEQRFKQDEPSGIRESLKTLVVGGAPATAFYSTNARLGATHEVWIVHRGFLYELTTPKPLDSWLGEIIQTWKFV